MLCSLAASCSQTLLVLTAFSAQRAGYSTAAHISGAAVPSCHIHALWASGLTAGNRHAGGSAWDASSTPGLTPVRAGSGGDGGGGGRLFQAKVPVRFAGPGASPALTPTWKSNQWAKPAEARMNGGNDGDRSPDLKEDLGKLLNDEEIRNNEQQLDRDWYDRRVRVCALTGAARSISCV